MDPNSCPLSTLGASREKTRQKIAGQQKRLMSVKPQGIKIKLHHTTLTLKCPTEVRPKVFNHVINQQTERYNEFKVTYKIDSF